MIRKIDAHWVRVENTAGVGMPDVNVSIRGREHWIELKRLIGGKLHMRAAQVNFAKKRIAHGGCPLVMWYANGNPYLTRASDLIRNVSISDCNSEGYYIIDPTDAPVLDKWDKIFFYLTWDRRDIKKFIEEYK